MAVHLSARLAWHADGWNGHICKNPAANTFCIGPHSYPGEMIAERRDVEWEEENQGCCCTKLEKIPPCIYSINAFGSKQLKAFSDPPDWFRDQTITKYWDIPPATVCIWPYEEMYYEELRTGTGYDAKARLENVKNYFAEINDQSLIFYYSNYSNPFSEDESKRYVLIGMSRVKQLGELMFYEGCSDRVKEKYGGNVWQRNVTSHYPDEGLRIPYHVYRDKPQILEQIVLFPDNPRNFKYGTRKITDDDALDLVERFLEIAGRLQQLGDTSEDWKIRIGWLQSLISKLWKNRGMYPGLPKVLELLGFEDAIPAFKSMTLEGNEKEIRQQIFSFLDDRVKSINGVNLSEELVKKIKRQWKLKDQKEQQMLREIFPRFDLEAEQMIRLLSDDRKNYSVEASLDELADNPYLMTEQYVGDNLDDFISFNKIDHGVFPSPELGSEPLAEKDDWRRLRALCVEQLRNNEKDTFLPSFQVLNQVNRKMQFLPEWKRHGYNERYFDVDKDDLEGALTFRSGDAEKYLYLRSVFESEREIEKQLRSLGGGKNIKLRSPLTEKHWEEFLYDSESPIAQKNPKEYRRAIEGQVKVCKQIFSRPLAVLAGQAGTGKTTVVRAIIRAIEKVHGEGTSFQLLAPTGKAADRLRERTQKSAATIHSFLAKRGWLNDNFTLRRSGGEVEEGFSTYIIDESSMLDLELFATLIRSINWTSVQRLILVGDPNQLPPIGRGRVFSDVVDWLKQGNPESIGVLKTNIRQMENSLSGRGTGILDLADLYLRESLSDKKDESKALSAELMLQRVQEGGTIDKDLRVVYWQNPEELTQSLINTLISDMEQDTGLKFDENKPYELLNAAFQGSGTNKRPEYQQVISPYRGEQFGTDYLNGILQKKFNGKTYNRIGHLDNITIFDKVIQIRNRPRSDKISAYNTKSKATEDIEIFNGEIGFVKPHGFDGMKWVSEYFRLEHFQIVFSRKENYWVGYGKKLGRNAKGRYLQNEPVEENLELAYVISVHKAQGSEFDRVYFILPKSKMTLVSPELFYTGITRATRHCTLFVQEDISPLLRIRRPEKSHLLNINSSLFEFRPIPQELKQLGEWYEEGKIHQSLAEIMVRSKSEIIVANMLFERKIPFRYETPLYAPDGTFYLPDFTITWKGEEWYWEHLGMLKQPAYRKAWENKKAWYKKHFPGRLMITEESGKLSIDTKKIIEKYFT